MSDSSDWSPDEPSGTEAFEQGDEAFDNADQLDPDFLEGVEVDPSLDPTLMTDERELEEAGVELDDPESMATLSGGLDDPDGLGTPSAQSLSRRSDLEGWDLDQPELPDADDTQDSDDTL
jgi:hypothetical protein